MPTTKRVHIKGALRTHIAEGTFTETLPDLEYLAANSEKLFGLKASAGTIRVAEQDLVQEGWLFPPQQGLPTRINPEVQNDVAYQQQANYESERAKLIESLRTVRKGLDQAIRALGGGS